MSKKILMLNYEFPPLGGGASPVSYEIAKGLVKRGHRVDVVTMRYKDLPEYEVSNGIHVYRVNCLRSKKEICYPLEQLTYIISSILFLREHMKNYEYDINHTHFIIPTGIISLWLKKKYGLEYVITSHGSDVPGYNPDRFKFLHKFTKPILKMICQNCKTIISPSNYLANLIKREIGFRKIVVIPNGIYIEKFKPNKNKRKIIFSSGRLLPRKGFQYLIKAVSHKKYEYEVHIAGDGPMMEDLRSLAKRSKTSIIFHGWLDNNSAEYKNLLETASIYVLASERENASIALLEAMSAGCAVITTNVSGCPETVGDSGEIVPVGDHKVLNEKIEHLIENERIIEELGKKARRRVLEHYDWEKVLSKYEKLML